MWLSAAISAQKNNQPHSGGMTGFFRRIRCSAHTNPTVASATTGAPTSVCVQPR